MKYIPFPDRYDKMKYNRCGNSGLLMPAISLGLWHNFGDDMLHKTKVDLCTTAFNLGITHFDLANNYGPPAGGAEKSFGRILRDEFRGLRDQLLISTKAGAWSWEGPYGEWGTRKSVIASCDQSLSRLGIPYVDIFYIDRFDPNTPLEETMLALDQIVRSGRALYIGMSNYPLDVALEAYHILKSLNTPLIVHQNSHSLLSAADKYDEMVEEIASYGLGAIAFSPLAQGLLSNTYLKGIPKDKYRIVVYDAAGNYVQTNDFTYGSSSARFSLNAGQDYTFVGYSTNSTSAVPAVSNISKLSTAQLKDISGTLMFFKKSLKLVYGNNNLDLVLQHQFSQITTTVKMDDAMTGAITTLTGMSISPSKSTASLNFSDGSLTYATANTSTGIVFPALTGGLRSITSSPTLLISPNTSTAALTIGSITLDGETKSNIPVPNIKIVPGYRYNLVLNFKTCTQNVTSDVLNWNYERTSWTVGRTTYYGITKDGVNYKNNEVITNTFNAPMANYGFQFDITEFDNAFNMQVNGQYIFGSIINDQVQFQTNTRLGTVRNIEFVDGTEYSTNGIPEVFDMKGTAAAPLLRILISRNGEVSLLGSKSGGGELVALRLKAGAKFNTVNWNTTGNNTVIISQKVDGKTVIIGTGNGRKMISCKTN
ncbi:aldo/keto reductase [Sphingobacterium siyangense]|uniref:aldo/keto reductase n=1 Tax=Sphingobacterium TaxID=28453 RepID=UPI003DA4C622